MLYMKRETWNQFVSSPTTPVQLLMSLQATVTVFSTTSMLTICSFTSRCAPTTHLPDCPFLPHVLPKSDSGVVHAERPAAQPGQIRSTDRRNGTLATCCDINCVVRHCRRRQSAASQRKYVSIFIISAHALSTLMADCFINCGC